MVSQAGALALGGHAARRALVRVLPHAARQRADLQQRHRGHEGHLRRLPRRDRPRRPGPLAPVGPRHRADGQRARHGLPGARHRGRGAPLRRVGGRATRTAPSTCGSSRCRGSSASSRRTTPPLQPGRGHRRARRRRRRARLHRPGARLARPMAGRSRAALRRCCPGCATSTATGWRASPAARRIVVLDNHWIRGGQGDAVRAALPDAPVEIIGVDRVPECGTNDEVLRAHGLDAASPARSAPADASTCSGTSTARC